MNKIILVLCAVLATAKGNLPISFEDHSNSIARTDEYIQLYRLHFSQVLKDFDIELKKFIEHYLGRTKVINIQLDMVTDGIVQIENYLNPLELLSDLSKHCILKYRSKIPSVITATENITKCVSVATSHSDSLISAPLATRSYLESYYNNSFENEIEECHNKYLNSVPTLTSCITNVTSDANAHTIEMQKNFETQMDAAECTAKINIKAALDCSYTVQTYTTTQIAETKLLIKRCMEGKDDCKPCIDPVCKNVQNIKVNYKEKTIKNPFFEKQEDSDCLLLKVR